MGRATALSFQYLVPGVPVYRRCIMKEFVELVERIVGGPLAGWALASLLALYLLRNKIADLWDTTLVKLGTIIGGSWSYRRFDPEYRRILRENHLLAEAGWHTHRGSQAAKNYRRLRPTQPCSGIRWRHRQPLNYRANHRRR